MKSWLRWIGFTLGLAVAFHLLTVYFIPRGIMTLAMRRLSKRSAAGINSLVHAPRVTVDSRQVVKPSPDLLYSICVYDVSEKPLWIAAPVPDTYWSISFYQTNTDNFYVLNDRQANSNPVNMVLVGPDMAVPQIDNAQVVVAPTNQGIFLLRSLIEDEKKLGQLMKIQKLASSRPL